MLKQPFLSVFLMLYLFSSNSVSAQINGSSGHTIFAVEVGYTNFRPYSVNSYLFPNTTGFTNLITYGGGWFATVGGRSHDMTDGAIMVHFFQPQKLLAFDSTSYQIRGWELMTSLFGYDVLRSVDAVDLTIGPGVYWGSLKMRRYFNNSNTKQFELFKNPFVAPMIRGDLRFVFGPVAFGGRASWRYDITKARWKKGSSVTLPGYKFEELQYMVYIGIRFQE